MLGPGVSRSVSAMKCCKTCRWWDADNTEVDAFGKPARERGPVGAVPSKGSVKGRRKMKKKFEGDVICTN